MMGRFLCWFGWHSKPRRRQVVYVCRRCWHIVNEERLP
jgi:hypothetical protein